MCRWSTGEARQREKADQQEARRAARGETLADDADNDEDQEAMNTAGLDLILDHLLDKVRAI